MVAVEGPGTSDPGGLAEVEQRLADATQLCEAAGERISTPRLRTLELVLQAQGPVKAYDLAQRFHRNRAASPTTVYRALKFWESLGLVRRIETMNAFVACSNPNKALNSVFLICSECGASAEVALVSSAEVEATAMILGFKITHLTLEAAGRCRKCAHPVP